MFDQYSMQNLFPQTARLLVGALFLTSCAGRPVVGYFPSARSTTYAPAPERMAPSRTSTDFATTTIPTPVPLRPAPRPVVPAAHVFSASPRVGRAAVRRLARIRAVTAHVRKSPASNLGKGLGKVLLWAAIILLVVIGLVIVAVSAPATLAGQIAIGILATSVLVVLASIALQ